MKRLILIPILLLALLCRAQTIPYSLVCMSSLTDLRAAVPQANEMVTLLGIANPTDGNGANYIWISTSTTTDDGFNFIAVTGITTGRWVRMGNVPTLNSAISRPVNSTAFTISTTKTALVFYNIQISCTASIGSTSLGSVALQWFNTGTSTWITQSIVANSNTVTLAITLNSVNVQSAVLSGVIPAGVQCRLVSVSTGTTAITFLSGTEYY